MLLTKDTLLSGHDCLGTFLRRSRVRRRLWLGTKGQAIARAVDRTGVLLIHVPKTGGTSISQVLYARNLPHWSAPEYAALFGSRLDNWVRVAVIRDPVARFFSAYRFILQGGTDLMLTSRFERLRLGSMVPLGAFVARLEANPELLQAAMPLRPQAPFVTDGEGRLSVDRLYALDARPGVADELARWLGVATLPRLNRTQDTPMTIEEDLGTRVQRLYAQDARLHQRVVAAGGCLIQNAAGVATP